MGDQMTTELIQLEQKHEQDVAAAMTWWRNTSNANKIRVWDAIQKDHSDPVAEIVSRFAQVGATHVAILAEKERLGTE